MGREHEWISEEHRLLTGSLLTWLSDYPGLFATQVQYEHRADFSALFAITCSPATATTAQRLIAAQYLIIFALLDDISDAELDELDRSLHGGAPCSSPSAIMMRRCYDSFFAGLAASSAASTEEYREDFRLLCAGFRHKRRADKATLREEEYRQIRPITVAVKPYIECWNIMLPIAFSPALRSHIDRYRITPITVEICYLENDLASVERDEETLADPNIVVTRARQTSREAAIESVIALHNQRIEDLHRACQLAVAAAPRLTVNERIDCHRYIEIITAVVSGTLEGSKLLRRYHGSAHRLNRLHRI